eukprot:5940589-Pyramimonas_sp.AAC.1
MCWAAPSLEDGRRGCGCDCDWPVACDCDCGLCLAVAMAVAVAVAVAVPVTVTVTDRDRVTVLQLFQVLELLVRTLHDADMYAAMSPLDPICKGQSAAKLSLMLRVRAP